MDSREFGDDKERVMRAFLLAAVLLIPTPLVWAQDEDTTDGFYFGVGLGGFSTDIVTIDRGNKAHDSGHDLIFGAGIGDTIAERLKLRAEYEVVEIGYLDDRHAVWHTAAWRF